MSVDKTGIKGLSLSVKITVRYFVICSCADFLNNSVFKGYITNFNYISVFILGVYFTLYIVIYTAPLMRGNIDFYHRLSI